MRFNLSSTALGSRLLTLSRVINSKNSLPILDCFLFSVHDGQLTVTASDSENVMRGTLNLENCEGEGDFAVNNHTILDAVKELPEQPLSLDVDMGEMKIYITYQNGSYNFPILNADEYPKAQTVSENATTITIDAGILSDNVNRSLFATAQDELRPVMNGIYFDLQADSLAIVASDGHKLVRNKNFMIKSDIPASFILPKKPATLLKNVLSKDGGDVVIRFDDRSADISFAEGNLSCRLIEGKYPNYNSVIPQDNPNQVTIDRKSLIGALRRVLPFASDSSQLIRFHVAAGLLELRAEDIDFATSAKESVTCEYGGNPMDIGFKGSSMLEILNNLESEDVTIQLADPSRAGIIIPGVQPENEDILMLIMPMLLND
ncbi:DNA polymerase III subunit beta [Prevotella histicola]|jgi:DNA polymerase III, beta subunit|uniref:Beta sliding clamp n=2 Tax=Prevotella histicola TaxID=470565 RepID=G6AF27_9BACT|nr:DNA polymerase III subunit beta [Prevotella histicola]EHG16577.1 DNA polymerase III, beta subunit [Prevotella histicola F0411]KGF31223.1 DNA polymerase III subunit beta [Prevotella histicola JCM 15637 = DNF00424]MBF1391627.1 DNA polymerase III subunit beta [Prevotella histicola]MBF1398101.1 DNA polymerase III subunit beta [Prevotella histicola]MBF1399391.1 DNA polymerase III subunit beta [Prevotella histicola]